MIEFFKKIFDALNLWAKNYLKKDVPESNLPAWYRLARIELGVQEIVGPQHNKRILEYHRQTSLEATDDETIVFSWIAWPSKEVRDSGNKAAMEDERFAAMGPESMPFDGKRMIMGGFVPIVDTAR